MYRCHDNLNVHQCKESKQYCHTTMDESQIKDTVLAREDGLVGKELCKYAAH